MIARWLARLQEFDFSIEHRPGNKHLIVDGLSRCHSCKDPQCPGYAGLLMPTSRRELKRIEKGKLRNVPKYALDGPSLVTPVVTLSRSNHSNGANFQKIAPSTSTVRNSRTRPYYFNGVKNSDLATTNSMMRNLKNRSIYLNGAKFQNSLKLHQLCEIVNLRPYYINDATFQILLHLL